MASVQFPLTDLFTDQLQNNDVIKELLENRQIWCDFK